MKKALKVLFLISYALLWHQVWWHNKDLDDLFDWQAER